MYYNAFSFSYYSLYYVSCHLCEDLLEGMWYFISPYKYTPELIHQC